MMVYVRSDVDVKTREQIDTRGVCSFYGQVGIKLTICHFRREKNRTKLDFNQIVYNWRKQTEMHSGNKQKQQRNRIHCRYEGAALFVWYFTYNV